MIELDEREARAGMDKARALHPPQLSARVNAVTATHELWNTQTGNLVGAFETEDAALETARKAAESYGPVYVDSLLLGREDNNGRSKKIAKGAALAQLAQTKLRPPAPRSA